MVINIEYKGCSVTPINRIRLQFEICQAIRQSPEQINILFATTGGEISEGLLFYEFARKLDCSISIYNIGEIRSAGTVMFSAFDNRYFLPKSKFLFHAVKFAEGTVITPEKEEQRIKFNEQMLAVYQERLLLPNTHFITMRNSNHDIIIDNPKDIEQFSIATSSTEKFFPPFIKIPC